MRVGRWLAAILALGGAFAAVWVFQAPVRIAHETFVDIPAGTGTPVIAGKLKQAGVIRSQLAFEVYRKLHGGRLKAGEYRFRGPMKLGDVYGEIARGDVYTIALVVPEGFNIFDIAAAAQAAGLGSATDFLRAARTDAGSIADLSPGATSLEGYLFPATYRFGRHATADQMVAAMVKRFRQVAAQIGLLSRTGLIGDRVAYDVPRTVTLASLIEKEVSVDAERGLVAGVFANRIRTGMPLATDPTVIYAALLAGRWRGTIYQSDLQYDSPYNTYRRRGLPPGPIANPGIAALQAAMHPAATKYVYFVADAQGHSQFSVDLTTHTAQVRAYREKQGQAKRFTAP